ncbi:hypothetical protein [Sediminibacterium sp.]|uniref:hypothetical protein n=1 Tax=Sediminibacterium sp. TaxID=1917865 RepID=UPI0025E99361|nr:hypothetical protein [Sediminibacterium sp.]MBT9484347.1 hypothetical protein [Sediminibacterium sp.]
METINNSLETLIKLRHLSESLNSNWDSLNSAKLNVNQLLDEANSIIKLFGTDIGKTRYQEDKNSIDLLKDKIESQLSYFKNAIDSQTSDDSSVMYREFLSNADSIALLFTNIGKYPDDHFTGMNNVDWFGVWAVIQSNIYTIQGIAHSAFIQLQMFEKFNKQEIDLLSKEIIKYIPKSYHINDAIQYKQEYMTALAQMEEEANKKDNLWDRLLNLLAGNVPFKQTPQERVMMMRWLNGEKGELK